MPEVPLGKYAYNRQTAGEPEIYMLNRFFEQNPTNLATGNALLSRPGTTAFGDFGEGPIRGFAGVPGAFNGDLFVFSGNEVYRTDNAGTTTLLAGIVLGSDQPQVTFMVGAGYEFMFVADGLLLQFYPGGSRAEGVLTVSAVTPPNIATQVLNLGGIYYGWSATVNTGTPDGTVANPFLVLVGANDEESLANMASAISYSGVRGTTYSSTLGGPHPTIQIPYADDPPTPTTITFQAKSEYADGNTLATVVTSGGDMSFGAATLTGGGVHALSGVATPDGAAISSLATLASHVIAVVANTQKFYWITPGETTIDPLNFASAESEPDNILSAITVGDQVWLLGQSATEAWYATGELSPAFAPIQGRAYARGVVPGTTVRLKDSVFLVGDDRVVYKIAGGLERVSNHGIEERIRRQLRREAEAERSSLWLLATGAWRDGDRWLDDSVWKDS